MDLSQDEDDKQVRKMRILQKISEDIENGSVYENKLQQLEILENLLAKEGLKAPDSLKEAFCAVARECTAKYLVCAEGEKQRYIDAIKRIWLRRIMDLFQRGSSLISPDLKNCAKEVKAAMCDEQVCKRLREDNTRNKALLSLKRFVYEQLTGMDQNSHDRTRVISQDSPVCCRGTDNNGCETETVRKNLGNEGVDEKQGVNGDMILDTEMKLQQQEHCNSKENNEDDDGRDNGEHDREKGPQDVEVGLEVREKVSGHEPRASTAPVKVRARKRWHTHPVKISDAEEPDTQPSPVQINNIPTPEINRVLEDLRTSKLEMLGALRPTKVLKNLDCGTLNTKQEDGNVTDSGSEGNSINARDNEPKISLMERNHTARTYEWNDSIEDAPMETGSGGRIHLPSPRRVAVSPLRRHQPTKGANRRRRMAWLPEETEALKEGVARYGRQWKKIKLAFPVILARRTEIDLKDKYRVETGREDAYNEVSE